MTTTVATPTVAQERPATHRWTRAQYEQMIEAGILTSEDKVELINGIITPVSPQRSGHATALMLVFGALQEAYGPGYSVRPQLLFMAGDDSEPEPDIAVVAGDARTYRRGHPSEAVLIVEIAEASLPYDRTTKVALYAQCGVPEYWIYNVATQELEFFREPQGDTYATKETIGSGEMVAVPETSASIAMNDLLIDPPTS